MHERKTGQRTPCTLLQLIRDILRCILLIEIRRNVVCLAFAKRIQLFARLLTGFLVSRRYVNSCTIPNEAFADHAADAFRAACDEDDFALRHVR
jgi:hypothetical protein